MAKHKLSVAALVISGIGFAGLMSTAAEAQSPSTSNSPTSPTSSDPSYGTSMSPSTMTDKTPLSMNPEAARKEGSAPKGTQESGATTAPK